ncbi:MAG: type II toxin-antitoxin system RelE/ParE family toxin [Prolixibacteraceae bacterium]|jgi:plasmid stabilization system protein ParE|nr:type II toxin-antitoxin system RelE/ParE family toxin [Prolixibacteraceae bacterium]MBT6005536.1 type II toxin-antitoxin system RelE/ParE family toxin [Prolixibacteraceae bacterium]MBT6764204.1 type II toxin-antitoxin system RelE/ParE family toxin [Prolixibacteraceae bacterium]MBT6999127.1 type II toxin-antitoxin system RelE/ParE family toxin [Prolixibacteraceae bacterium]MBT7396081.1 type II toxin-antitoxin system RelE/ParE family toxin [Prolixibacteraceae bacterium]
MALEIRWSKKADNKFDQILEYLRVEWGEKVTSDFVKKVFDFLEILSEFPEIGTVENRTKSIRGFSIIKQIKIFYKINKNYVTILNFYDTRQNPKNKRY